MPQKMFISTKKTLPTYTRLRGVSWYAMKLVDARAEGWGHHCMTAMVFSAFCLEAFLNHLGKRQIPFWEPLKKKLNPHEKLKVLSTTLGFRPDFGRRPYQTFKTIFKLRDLLVHAETETLTHEGSFVLSPGEMPPEPLTKWEELLTVEGARRFVDDTKSIIEDLCDHAGIDKSEAFAAEVVTWSGTHQSNYAEPSS